MNKNFLINKPINESLLKCGFTIPTDIMEIFASYLRGGRLAHGEKRTVKLFLGGEIFDVTLRSIGFNQKKHPNRKDMWQINYSGVVAERVREIFSAQENFLVYAKGGKDEFYLEPSVDVEETTLEKLLDASKLTDPQAAMVKRFGLIKYRKLNRKRGEDLKRNYRYRCQICGQSVGEVCGVKVVDCHHIAPFSQSLNNDTSNLLIVCPNHHRIIHAANPTFDRERKLYLYPNGYEETLRLNDHL